MSVFMVLLVFFVWLVLTFYSYRVLSSAANEGAAVAARYDSTPAEGKQTAEDLISAAGATALVENVVVTAGPKVEGSQEPVTVTVSGTAVTPLFSMNLTATGSAPAEEFRPQGEEVGP